MPPTIFPTRYPRPGRNGRCCTNRSSCNNAGPRGEVDAFARASSACLTRHIAVRSPPHIPLPCAAAQSEGGPTAAARGGRKGDPRPWTHTTRLGPPAPTSPARRGVVARIVTGPHEANRQDPHRPMRYDTGRPRAVIRLRISQPRTASLPCPAGLRARRPSPMMDLYRKNVFSTRP